jgi:polyhydroxyalkanoate synthase
MGIKLAPDPLSMMGRGEDSRLDHRQPYSKPMNAKPEPCSPAEPTLGTPDISTASTFDRALHAQLARMTQGISPASVIGSYMDWLVHLAMSPGKQADLLLKAQRKATRLGLEAMRCKDQADDPCIEPLPQDRRFAAPEWQRWPFNLIYQAFLLNQQWWHNATTGVEGVSTHHEQLATFFTRQWLDMFSPSNFVATNPEVLAEIAKTGGANLLQGAQNRLNDALQMASGRPAPGTEHFRPGHEVAVTPGKVIFRNHLIELIQYAPQTEAVFADPVLIVPSWIMKYYILDLSPHNSLVRYLVERGHTVFIMSWKNPDSGDRDLGMDDYLKSGVMAAVDAVERVMPKRKIQALGYCLGGTLLSIAAAYMARSNDTRLKSLTLLASELDFTEPGELGLFIDESQLAYLDDLMSEKGYLDGKQMAGAFAMLNSRDLVWSRMEHEYLMGRGLPVSDLIAWNADATRMPYRQHHEYLRSLYLRNDLAEGRYLVDGKPVVLSDIRVPMFVLGTQRDTVSPWHSVYKINLLTDTEVTFCLSSGGHNVGVVNPPGPGVSRNYWLAKRSPSDHYTDPETWLATSPSHEGSWWPAWEAWLAAHGGRNVAPPSMGSKTHTDHHFDDAPGQYVLVA